MWCLSLLPSSDASDYIVGSLLEVAESLEQRHSVALSLAEFELWKKTLEACAPDEDERRYFVQSQLQALFGQLKEIRRLTHELQIQVHGDKVKALN